MSLELYHLHVSEQSHLTSINKRVSERKLQKWGIWPFKCWWALRVSYGSSKIFGDNKRQGEASWQCLSRSCSPATNVDIQSSILLTVSHSLFSLLNKNVLQMHMVIKICSNFQYFLKSGLAMVKWMCPAKHEGQNLTLIDVGRVLCFFELHIYFSNFIDGLNENVDQ